MGEQSPRRLGLPRLMSGKGTGTPRLVASEPRARVAPSVMADVRTLSCCGEARDRQLIQIAQLHDQSLCAVDEQGLPVVQGAVSDPFGAVSGHDQLNRGRLGMPR